MTVTPSLEPVLRFPGLVQCLHVAGVIRRWPLAHRYFVPLVAVMATPSSPQLILAPCSNLSWLSEHSCGSRPMHCVPFLATGYCSVRHFLMTSLVSYDPAALILASTLQSMWLASCVANFRLVRAPLSTPLPRRCLRASLLAPPCHSSSEHRGSSTSLESTFHPATGLDLGTPSARATRTALASPRHALNFLPTHIPVETTAFIPGSRPASLLSYLHAWMLLVL